MSNASAIRSLADDIAQAQEERTRRVAGIRKEAADLLRGFDKAHSKMSAQLRSELAKMQPALARDDKDRKKASQAEAKERAEWVAEIARETADLLQGFDRVHSEMSAQLRSELAKVQPGLASAEEDRQKVSQAEAKERAERVAEIARETADLLQGFDKTHSEMSARLRSELSKVQPGLASAEEDRQKASQAEAKERADEVSRVLAEARELAMRFTRDSADTAAAWRELVATMQAKRGGVAVAPPPVAKVVAEEASREEAIPPEKAGLENRILELVRAHPQGTKLTEIAEAVGEARIKVGNITRMLVDEGKINKEGLLYSPVE